MKVNFNIGSAGKRAASGGISTVSALGLIFVAAKLWGVVDWSWWWVTLPFWGPFVLMIGLCIAAGLAYALVLLGAWLWDERDWMGDKWFQIKRRIRIRKEEE